MTFEPQRHAGPRLPLFCLLALLAFTAATRTAGAFDIVAPCSLAGSITVNTLSDAPILQSALDACSCDSDPAAGNQCTLRAAVQLANRAQGADEIVLPGDRLLLSVVGAGDATVGDLNIGPGGLTIQGAGADSSEIDASGLGGGGESRAFFVPEGAQLELRRLRITGGHAVRGGALHTSGDTSLVEVLLDGNRAVASGGAVELRDGGTLSIIRSHFENNIVEAVAHTVAGGALAAHSEFAPIELSIIDSSFRNNPATGAENSVDAAIALRPQAGGAIDIRNSSIRGGGRAVGVLIHFEAQDAAAVSLRNVTIEGVADAALMLRNAAGISLDVANSLLQGGEAGCRIVGLAPTDFRLGHSLVNRGSDCAAYYNGVTAGLEPNLGGWLPIANSPAHVRVLNSILSGSAPEAYAVDLGIPLTATPASEAQACLAVDARGMPRPVDGDLDGVVRCDVGAFEVQRPNSAVYLVTSNADLPDVDLADGLCQAANGLCTLRAAVMQANAKPGTDAIRFAALDPSDPQTRFDLTLPHAGGAAASGDLDITDNLLIAGRAVGGRPVTHVHQTVDGERVFEALGGLHLIMRDLRVSGGRSGAVVGGGLRMGTTGAGGVPIVSANRVEWLENHSGTGGGAIAVVAGQLNMVDSDLHSNHASGDGLGGALYVGPGAEAFVDRTSFWNNRDDGVQREAIHVAQSGLLVMGTSTVSGNDGGIHALGAADVVLSLVTIADNLGDGLRAQFLLGNADRLSVGASIIAGNGADCVLQNAHLANALSLDRYNVIGTATPLCANHPSNVYGSPSRLLPLAQPAGQLSRIMQPSIDAENFGISPAVDLAPIGECFGLLDQRMRPRPQVQAGVVSLLPCDAGAVEAQWDAPRADTVFRHGFEL
jgi:hypothetical protein